MIESSSVPRIAIVGGGIGDLAAAAFLNRVGLSSVIYEQAEELKEVGAGLVVAPNAGRLHRRLGSMERLQDRAVPLEAEWEFRRRDDGRVLSAEHLAESCESLYGERPYTVHRADLADPIADSIPHDTMELGECCTSVTVHDGGSAVLTFAGGASAAADVVIANAWTYSYDAEALEVAGPV